jgi:hypothetical protein
MLYQQLATTLKEIGQRLRAVRALEDVVLLMRTQGRSRRLAFILSRNRVNSFSSFKSSVRAISHWSRGTTGWCSKLSGMG